MTEPKWKMGGSDMIGHTFINNAEDFKQVRTNDFALAERLLAFLNTEPVMYACGNQWHPISDLDVLKLDADARQIYAVHLVPVSVS